MEECLHPGKLFSVLFSRLNWSVWTGLSGERSKGRTSNTQLLILLQPHSGIPPFPTLRTVTAQPAPVYIPVFSPFCS